MLHYLFAHLLPRLSCCIPTGEPAALILPVYNNVILCDSSACTCQWLSLFECLYMFFPQVLYLGSCWVCSKSHWTSVMISTGSWAQMSSNRMSLSALWRWAGATLFTTARHGKTSSSKFLCHWLQGGGWACVMWSNVEMQSMSWNCSKALYCLCAFLWSFLSSMFLMFVTLLK